MVTLDEAKIYLRADSGYEDSLIESIRCSAESLVIGVARLSAAEWTELSTYTADNRKVLTIRGEEKSKDELLRMKELLRIGVMYAIGYLYEHREEADHHELVLTLRDLLSAIREGVF